jgi:hypothetical protein
MGNWGIPDPSITVVPDYSRSIRAQVEDTEMPHQYLPYEWSEAVKTNPDDHLQWHHFQIQARNKIGESMATLKRIYYEDVPTNIADVGIELKEALTNARKSLDAYMAHDPADEATFKKNEVPRYSPEGVLNADDATKLTAGGSRLVPESELPAQAAMETILFRLDRDIIGEQYWQPVDDAATKMTEATRYLTYGESPTGRPDVKIAYEQLRDAKIEMSQLLRNAGAEHLNVVAKWAEKMKDMTPTETRMYGGAALGALALTAAITTGVVVFHDD